MKIAICDDNMEYVSQIQEYLKELDINKLNTDVYQSGEDLAEAYRESGSLYDAIFLDMEMGRLNGIETANFIRKRDNDVIIVFITNHSQYMEKCFECSPFDFLLKPVKFDRFKEIFDKILIKVSEEPKFFVFSDTKGTVRIPCRDVVYFEVQKHNLIIYKNDGTSHKIRRTITDLIKDVDPSKFVRIHRSYIINLSYVYKIDESSIELQNTDNYIPLSSTYKSDLQDAFMAYRERRYFI